MTHEGREWSFCVNTFNPQVDPYGPGLDYVLGDIFMRNVYSVYVSLEFCHAQISDFALHFQVQLRRLVIHL